MVMWHLNIRICKTKQIDLSCTFLRATQINPYALHGPLQHLTMDVCLDLLCQPQALSILPEVSRDQTIPR
ncbi:hypothetical protein DERF_010776 [Dermatophagoides farinae]|uniref:Uncharacterized protein n=1 Tax=Dermatophagoides farinae TaxID=6954 RepID=A0A922L2G8_DERFA|nr:hypothetical protein DERF_010776 [Dermatophagoides farinae]